MKILSLLKNNKLFTVFSSAFLIWLVFLIIQALIGQRTVIFYDALGQIDVSSEFTSNYPLSRYFIEPFTALALFLDKEFTWMFIFLINYPIFRVIYFLVKKRGFLRSEKYRYALYSIMDIISFSFQVLILSVLIVGIYIFIGFLIQGYFFVSRYFMIPIQLAIHISYVLIIIKVSYVFIKAFHPNLKLNLSRKILKTKRNNKLIKIKREAKLFVGIGVILLSSNIILISTPFPAHQIVPTVPLAEDEFLFDFHVHTTFSDGWLTVEQRINWYLQQGISGAAFSDHDNIRGASMALNYVSRHNLDFIVFMAEEWTDNENDIHMNIYGLAEEIVPLQSYTPGGPTALNASDTINYVKSNGGYITVNHYNYKQNPKGGFGVPYTLDQLKNWGIDGFEIVNGGGYSGKYMQIRQFCLDNNLTCIGGSDIETNKDLNTFIKMRLVDPSNLTIANIFETLKNNTHQVIAVDLYPKIVDFPGDLNDSGFYVLEIFINYILNMDVFQALSWLFWSSFGYTILFLFYRKIRKSNLWFIKNKVS
ncbi:MAG: PHP domain-containing protein [Candidatus Hermodarchaeota archaeon]